MNISKTAGRLASLVQFFPLTIFVAYALAPGVPTAARWLDAFLVGGVLAFLQIAFALLIGQGQALNTLVLGVNFYLMVGALGTISGFKPLLYAMNELRESGLLLCMVLVGLFTTLFSPAGFISKSGESRRHLIKTYSWVLLLVATVGLLFSFVYRGDLRMSAALPVFTLAVVRRILVWRFEKKALQCA